MRMNRFALIAACFMANFASHAMARTIRFTALTPSDAQLFKEGNPDLTIAFVKGDHIPLRPSIAGNLLATLDNSVVTALVQRNFFLKREDKDVLISADGSQFDPIGDKIHGQLSASVSADDSGESHARANAIVIDLIANLSPGAR